METPIDAYEFTLQKIKQIKESGIDVVINPSKSRTNIELIEKFNKPDRIPPDKWVNVSFRILDKSQAIKIYEVANYLGMCGIGFDTGGCPSCRDWELDWSFRYHKGDDMENLREAREEVEDIINQLNNLEINDENIEM